MKKILILLFSLILVVSGGYYYFHQPKDPHSLTLYGNVEYRQVDLSFKIPGRLEKLFVEEGDQVKKGQLVASLDASSYLAEQKRALANVASLTTAQEYANTVYDRRAALEKTGAISREELDTYRKNKDTSLSQLAAAQEEAAVATDNLNNTSLYAPNDGTVTVRAREQGATVAAGSTVYTLALAAPIWIRTYIDEPHLGNITYGTKVTIYTDSKSPQTNTLRSYQGHIGYISPTAEFTPKTVQTENLRTDLVYRLRVYVDNADDFLRQGMPVSLTIKLQETEIKK